MPCRDGGPSPEQVREERDIPKVLCALLTRLEASASLDRVLAECDWVEAGVEVEWVRAWWAKHKIEDALRRKYEAARREEQRVAAEARAKLTPEERRALGIR